MPGRGVLPTVPAPQAPQPASASRSRLPDAPEPESGHNFPRRIPLPPPQRRLLCPCSPARGGCTVSQGARLLAASLGAHEVAGHQDTGQGASHGPETSPRRQFRNAPAPRAPRRAPLRGSAAGPSPSSPYFATCAAGTRRQVPPGPASPRRGTRSANNRSRARAPRSRKLTSPRWSGHLGAHPRVTPSRPPAPRPHTTRVRRPGPAATSSVTPGRPRPLACGMRRAGVGGGVRWEGARSAPRRRARCREPPEGRGEAACASGGRRGAPSPQVRTWPGAGG